MKWTCLLPLLAFLGAPASRAEVRLPAILSDHAMLQAEKPAAVWGWATPGARLKVAFVGDDGAAAGDFAATADAEGKWAGCLPPLRSGTAGRLEIESDKDAKRTVGDVLVGEVWLGGGQSNMYYTIEGKYGADPNNPEEAAEVRQNIADAQREADAARPPIRYFLVTSSGADAPQDDVRGRWVLGDSKNVATFSAVAWNFAVALQDRAHLPVGLISSSVGGTPAQAWMSRETLDATPVGAEVWRHDQEALAAVTPEVTAKYEADLEAWNAANPTPELRDEHAKARPREPYSATSYKAPVRLYNGMIHGLEPYTLRGILWFQADGNNVYPLEYSELFQALIKEWRAEWGEPLPFYFVELNNMGPRQVGPVEPGTLSILREQQHGGLLLPGVGMAAAIDVGTSNAHFPDKKPVGQRLAGLALRDCYGLPGQVDSPVFKSFAVEGGTIRLAFSDAGGLRVRGGGALKGFAIRGATGRWVWAEGRIDGPDIVVWSDQVPAPAAVRYGWAANPILSVENGAGLPLCPFRTDIGSPE